MRIKKNPPSQDPKSFPRGTGGGISKKFKPLLKIKTAQQIGLKKLTVYYV